LKYPGRMFLITQLMRAAAYLVAATAPPIEVFVALMFYWGFSVGLADATSRVIVQEMAPVTHRARIMSVYRLAILGASPLGAFVMGFVIASIGLLNSMYVGPFFAILIFIIAIYKTRIWQFVSVIDHH